MRNLFAIVIGLCGILASSAADFDLVVRGGRIVDGTGSPSRIGDVGIKDGRVAALGKFEGEAAEVIDATGLVVAPGFIDVHSHAENIDRLPLAENFVRMGVTTVVLGNCGSSRLNLGSYFKELEKEGISANVASLIGQGTVRSQVMGGSFMRPPSEEEIAEMRKWVERAMKDGAVGMSTGLIYLPGSFSKTEELIELAKVVGEHDGVYASHMRSEGQGIFKAVEELIRIAREAKVPAEISHIKAAGKPMWGRASDVLALIEKARSEGLEITHDEYMYTASSTGIQNRIPNWFREGGDKAFKARLADPELKAKVVAEMKADLADSEQPDFSYAFIASYGHDRSLNGLNVLQATQKVRGSSTTEDQIEMILEIAAHGGASGVFHSMNEDDLETYLRDSHTMIAADSSVRDYQEGVPHPRGYGNNARALARYVREQKVLPLEEMVRRMTSLPASTFRMKGRGILQEGGWADVVVFDPATIQDNATFQEPHQYSTGFKAVLVNGVPVVIDDVHTKARPGQIVRRDQ